MAIGLCLVPLGLPAADWPQWRGPQRNGISAETGLLAEWPKEGPRLVWQVKDIGSGYSTPSVVGDRLYLLSNQGLDNEFVQALDAKDGKQVWSQTDRQGRQPGPAAELPGGEINAHRGWRMAVCVRVRRRPGLPGAGDRQSALAEECAARITAASRGSGPTRSRRWLTARRWSARRAEANATLVALNKTDGRTDLEVRRSGRRAGGLYVGAGDRGGRGQAIRSDAAEGPRGGGGEDGQAAVAL